MYKNRKYILSSEFSIAAQNSKQVGVAIRRFVARFGRSKVRALGLVSSGVKEREANRSDVEKERLDMRRDRSGAVRGSHHHHRLFSDTRSIEITIKQHRGHTGNIQIYTQKDISNTESERDKDRNKNIEN